MWLKKEIQYLVQEHPNCVVANPYMGTAYINKAEKEYRASFHTSENKVNILSIVEAILTERQ